MRKEGLRIRTLKEICNGYSAIIPEENLELLEKVLVYKNKFSTRFPVIGDNRIKTSNKFITLLFRIMVLTGKY